jgi:oligopeptide/dipeptide ABC transporter ATP-binding protein
MTLLSVSDLSVEFATTSGPIRAVQGLSFAAAKGETVAIVGESGSGKSTAALALLRLIGYGNSGRISAGRIVFDGVDLLRLDEAGLRDIRGSRIGMIFQDPMMALNPVYTIGRQIAEPLMLHRRFGWSAATAEAVDLLRLVGIPAPEQRVTQYPHNLSGGMRQRVMIAMALACRPDLLIADEPTTALDVTVQAQVLDLINDLKRKLGMAVLLITHDLGVVWETAQRVIVMYAGRKVEEGPVETLFRAPLHPYTSGLLAAAMWEEGAGGRLSEIPGTVPSALDLPAGCPFAPRCAHAMARCHGEAPALRHFPGDRLVACFAAGSDG